MRLLSINLFGLKTTIIINENFVMFFNRALPTDQKQVNWQ